MATNRWLGRKSGAQTQGILHSQEKKMKSQLFQENRTEDCYFNQNEPYSEGQILWLFSHFQNLDFKNECDRKVQRRKWEGRKKAWGRGWGQWTWNLQLEQKGRILRKTFKVGEEGVQGQPRRDRGKVKCDNVCMCMNAISEACAWWTKRKVNNDSNFNCWPCNFNT